MFALCLVGFVFLFSNFASAQQFASPGATDAIDDALKAARGAATGEKGLGTALAIAGSGLLNTAASIGSWGLILFGVLNLLSFSLEWFIAFGYGLLNTAANLALDPNWFRIDAVIAAWQLVRDFVNIWFILILLVIAITTILRVSSYQAKKLLPMLIIVALVVNFSMPITGFVIDISNIVAFQFLQAICPEVKTDSKSGCDFSGNIENGLNASALKSVADETVESFGPAQKTPKPGAFLIQEAHAEPLTILGVTITAFLIWKALSVLTAASFAYDLVKPFFFGESLFGGVAVGPFVSILVVTIFQAFTAFVILSMAILFLLRIISLMLIAILSPIGFAGMVLPSTQTYSNMWWSYLLKQSFFAPIALFFLWFALIFMKTMKDGITIAGQPFDFTNPTNLRLIFYVFSILLLYASLWTAKKMGAIGAETIIKWSNTARSAITGFVGGLAARNIIAPLGAAITAGGLPEAVGKTLPKWLLGPAAGVRTKEFAEWLAKRGGAPADAAAKAELGMRLSPADRGAYFAKLDRAAKEAMLRKMKGDDRESLIASLPDATQKQIARDILTSYAFTAEEQIKAKAEQFKYELDLPERWKQFGTLGTDTQKQLLLSIENVDDRAKFLQKVKENATADNHGLEAFENANTFLEESTTISADKRYGNFLARKKVNLSEWQKSDKLGEEFFKSDRQSEVFRFGANADQQLEIIEWAAKNAPDKLPELTTWVRKLDPEKQDQLFRDKLGKRASVESVVAFVDALYKDRPDKGTNPTPPDYYKKVIGGASPQQLAKLKFHWKQPGTENPKMVDSVDDIYKTAFTIQQQNAFDKMYKTLDELNKGGGGGSTPGGGPAPTPVIPVTPAAPAAPAAPTATTTSTQSRAMALSDEIDRINLLDRTRNANAIRFAIDELSKEPEFIKLRKKINILTEFEFVEKGKTPRELMEFLQREIPLLTETEIHYKIDAKTLANSTVRELVLQKANTKQLGRLVLDPERAKIIKEHLHNPGNFYESGVGTSVVERIARERNTTSYGARNIILQDKELYSEAIADIFEQGFKNRELAKTLSRISKTPKENLTNPGELRIKERLFE